MANEKDQSRFDQGPPGMSPDGAINTVGPDGKPTNPIKIYLPSGEVLTPEEFDAQGAADELEANAGVLLGMLDDDEED